MAAARSGSFQSGLLPGYGFLLLGVSGHTVSKNYVAGNDAAGIAVLGWCTATSLGDPARNCINDPPITDPSSDNNLIFANTLTNNGTGPPPVPIPPVDLLYATTPPPLGPEPGVGNCFQFNTSTATFFSTEPDGLLPTDGC